MIIFQALALAALLIVFLRDLAQYRRGSLRRLGLMLRGLVLFATGIAIAWPDVTQIIAEAFGIGRGADVVLYLSVLLLLFASFHHQTKTTSLQRQVTELVRHLAIEGAQRGANSKSEDLEG